MTGNQIRRKGSKQFEFEQPHLFAAGSEIRQDLSAGGGYGAGGYQNNISIFAIDGFDRAVGAIKYGFKFFINLHQAASGFLHGQLGIVAHFHVSRRCHQLVDGAGIGRIHPDARGGRR